MVYFMELKRIEGISWIQIQVDKNLPGQGFLLQGSFLNANPLHSSPPYDAFCTTTLSDIRVPPPQVSEQTVHSPYSDHWQSTINGFGWYKNCGSKG